MSREEIRANLASWEADSAEYQQRHAEQIGAWDQPLGWGTFSISEDEVHALGDVRGMDALEFGCGAAQFGIKVAMRGARVTGLDFSANQLAAAGPNMEVTGVRFPLVRADAERPPFADRSFDLVFCDHGVMAFADPLITVPEVARILRPGGWLVFSMSTPFICVTWPPIEGPPGASCCGRITACMRRRGARTMERPSTSCRTESGSGCSAPAGSRSKI